MRSKRLLIAMAVVVLCLGLVGAGIAAFFGLAPPAVPVRDYQTEYVELVRTVVGDAEAAFENHDRAMALEMRLYAMEEAVEDLAKERFGVPSAESVVVAPWLMRPEALDDDEKYPDAVLWASQEAYRRYLESDMPGELTGKEGLRNAWVSAPPALPLFAMDLAPNVLRSLALYERERFRDAVERGDTETAAESFTTIAGLGRAVGGSLFPSGALLSDSMSRVVQELVADSVNRELIDPQLGERMLGAVAEHCDRRPNLGEIIQMERLGVLDALQHAYNPQRESRTPTVLDVHARSYALAEEYYDLAAAYVAAPRSSRTYPARANEIADDSPRAYRVLLECLYSFELLPPRREIADLGVAGTRVMLALEIYRGRHGAFPPSLDDLVPEILFELPLDPFASDGRLGYRLRPDAGWDDPRITMAYAIYSVGYDAEDDHATMDDFGWSALAEGGEGDFVLNATTQNRLKDVGP